MRFNSLNPNCLATVKWIKETLSPKSHKVLENSNLPMVQDMEKLPRSFNLGDNLF